MSINAFNAHDHSNCIAHSLAATEAACLDQKLRLTKTRRRVLEILLTEHKALGAYEILDQLKAEGLGSEPPVVYRALDFLTRHDFAHRVEKLNAFVACSSPDKDHSPVFMICRCCDTVEESRTPKNPLKSSANTSGFHIESTVIEAEGLCESCQQCEEKCNS